MRIIFTKFYQCLSICQTSELVRINSDGRVSILTGLAVGYLVASEASDSIIVEIICSRAWKASQIKDDV